MTPSTSHEIYLPTEIVVQIMSYVSNTSDKADRRQATLYACCLVSRQWYSAAIPHLYEKPILRFGSSFTQFTATISPPLHVARKNKLKLGSYVRRLDLSGLVHHSSPSLTARLLGKVKENLVVFSAPRVSFAINSLPALSKCTKLQSLDLSLVGDYFPFLEFKRALSHLTRLTTLRLPRTHHLTPPPASTPPSTATSAIPWPPRLQNLQLTGDFSANPALARYFSWPPALTSLILKNCKDLDNSPLTTLFLTDPALPTTLRRLKIDPSNSLSLTFVNRLPLTLPDLDYLSVPGDTLDFTFFENLDERVQLLREPVAWRTLELDHPCSEDTAASLMYFTPGTLVHALQHGLAHVRAVGISEAWELKGGEVEEIDAVLRSRFSKKSKNQQQSGQVGVGGIPSPPTSVDEDEAVDDDDDDDDDIGVYYL
ncbi:F-box domain protein [Aspergillus brunneoviolaceus CBS 621.78]|uniref:Uncharacterized protein n=1 Tax=Aspergillus brunneoviolaceus CBS 621.78 TaxID=1450534 RepID=A0ACD1FYK0_9EURO|nr:hypothetical protein BO95DRAFT_435249 [Aspergillus brunneoviolaceus CBS 621.78]RAH42087.1 hypothetical protein BO95DRAFT_435249 [Aspergillus brunneoviolaceus CBS 621.78]